MTASITDPVYAIKSALFGLAVGDALGVPVEFKSREALKASPVVDMIGFGSHNQPPGTWSDDSSLTFCLAEALTQGFNIDTVAGNFIHWYRKNYWTARGEIFDIGIGTRYAIIKLEDGTAADLAGGDDENSNGNGSLMRILPLVFYIQDKPIEERFEITRQVSSITHRHIRSVISCFYYLEFARLLINGIDKFEIYQELQKSITDFLISMQIDPKEIQHFNRLLKGKINRSREEEITSSGYVLHTLEAGVWCLLTTGNYREAVLKAVNLGIDTDTTAAVVGGLAGLLYGFESIPQEWIEKIARKSDIEDLAERLATNSLSHK